MVPDPASGTCPWGPREVTGALDGQPVGLEVQPGARAVRLWVRHPGPSRFVVRRRVDLQRRGDGLALDLPVNPVATSHVSCDLWPGTATAEFPGARGPAECADGRACVVLGPVDQLRVRQRSDAPKRRDVPRVSVEGLMLWDAWPAGDRVHARFTYRMSTDLSEIRISLAKGMIVRSASVAGLVDTALETAGDRTVWVAHVDPPWNGSNTVQLDLWKPRLQKATQLVLPHVLPMGTDTFSWTLGFRRPGSWQGRLRPVGTFEAVPDDVFARAWGAFPDAPATLAGALRGTGPARARVASGPVRPCAAVVPQVQVQVEPGRLLVSAEARVTELEGPLREVVVQVAPSWKIIRVAANGLTSWSQAASDRLRLRFDGPDAGPRQIRLEGWIPVVSDPLRPPPATWSQPVPWPTWLDLDAEAGEIRVLAPKASAARLDPAPGAALAGAAAGVSEASGRILTAYRVEKSVEAPGTLVWTEPTPFTRVAVDSLLTLYPGSATLSAALNYQIRGGPLHTITFSLPKSWSPSANVTSDGLMFTIQKDDKENVTFWTLRPDRPVWGSLTLQLQAERTLERSSELTFPAVLPRGRGAVTSFLALANASGQPLITAGEGITAVAATSAHMDSLLPFTGIPHTTYRVTRDDWRLAVRPRPAPTEGAAPDITLADFRAVIDDGGWCWGTARLDLAPGASGFLPVRFRDNVRVLSTLVDGSPVRGAARPVRGVVRAAARWRRAPRRSRSARTGPDPGSSGSGPAAFPGFESGPCPDTRHRLHARGALGPGARSLVIGSKLDGPGARKNGRPRAAGVGARGPPGPEFRPGPIGLAGGPDRLRGRGAEYGVRRAVRVPVRVLDTRGPEPYPGPPQPGARASPDARPRRRFSVGPRRIAGRREDPLADLPANTGALSAFFLPQLGQARTFRTGGLASGVAPRIDWHWQASPARRLGNRCSRRQRWRVWCLSWPGSWRASATAWGGVRNNSGRWPCASSVWASRRSSSPWSWSRWVWDASADSRWRMADDG